MSLRKRFKWWKEWRICNKNTKLYQWLVLFGLIKSATFEGFITYKIFCEGVDEFVRRLGGM